MNAVKAAQLPLRIGLRETPRFGNYEPGPNKEAVGVLEQTARGAGETVVYLWGKSGTGKSHLLQAGCSTAAARGAQAAYVSLALAGEDDPEALSGLEHYDLVCIDDVDARAGDRSREELLFHFFNRAQALGTVLIIAAQRSPGAAGFVLTDLASRCASGAVLRLRPLGDQDLRAMLQRRARERGFEISDEVAAYVLRRCPRDMASLGALIDSLDQSTLIEQRRVTIPFVRSLLGEA